MTAVSCVEGALRDLDWVQDTVLIMKRFPGADSELGSGVPSRPRVRLLVRRAALCLLFVLGLTALPSVGRTGMALPLKPGLKALVVTDGYHSVLTKQLESHGFSAAVGDREDQASSSANAYGAALELINGRSPDGLLVSEVVEGSRAERAGLRNGDIVGYVSLPERCRGLVATLQSNWMKNIRCPSVLTVHRPTGIERLKFPSGALRDVSTRRVRSFVVPELPISMGAVSGTSMGLALSLLYLDELTGGGLFAVDHVAATGTVSAWDLTVETIGSLPDKALAAREAGVTVLFIPVGQGREVAKHPDMLVREVGTLADAVITLCNRGASSKACALVDSIDQS